MPHTDTIPVSASIASTGLGIRYIGYHVYGISGPVADASSSAANTVLFDFSTANNSYIIANLDFITNHEGTAGIYLDVSLNGDSVYKGLGDDAPTIYQALPLTFLIPGGARVVVKWGSSGNYIATAVLTGRVYGAE